MNQKFEKLPPVAPTEFAPLLGILSKIKIPTKTSNAVGRSAFVHAHRACAIGTAYHFTKKTINLSRMSRKHPDLHAEIMRLGELICAPAGHTFTSVYLNNNCISSPHRDKNNHGLIIIVSFGDYTGCRLVIEDEIADAHNQPIRFDGTNRLHWNEPDLVGNKFGLVFYPHKAIIKHRAQEVGCRGGVAPSQDSPSHTISPAEHLTPSPSYHH